jgi:hypothetical protein
VSEPYNFQAKMLDICKCLAVISQRFWVIQAGIKPAGKVSLRGLNRIFAPWDSIQPVWDLSIILWEDLQARSRLDGIVFVQNRICPVQGEDSSAFLLAGSDIGDDGNRDDGNRAGSHTLPTLIWIVLVFAIVPHLI